MNNFRFIESGSMGAANNMAIDEALADSLADHRDFAYLRVYGWSPATLSFGYNQKIDKIVDIEAVKQAGLGLVKRMSGGKMVFHNQELTFSLGMTAEFIARHMEKTATFLEMFKFAMEPMVSALVKTGVPARFSSSREMRQHSQNSLHCYAVAAGHSIFAGDRKLIGAAGIYRRNCLVIHGSIPLQATFPPAMFFKGPIKPETGVTMAALLEFIDQQEIADLPASIAQMYARQLNLAMHSVGLSQEETDSSRILAGNKYSNLFWTNSCE